MDMEEENIATETSRVRIFVGGLGEGVTADDLQRLFGSLGSVDGVEIIRTKGRSFAYVDFMPSPTDQKSLSKLFSRYNGCLWKGGKLKLEKAKEHYLVRLKQEWAEDAKLVSDEPGTDHDPDKGVSTKEMPSRESSMPKQLRIFFPRLKKVKSIPFSGTGKHKYSFPKVEVPPLPVHFCDCEEHSSPSGIVKGKQCYGGEAESGGMNDEEINIMNAVMSKLFEKEKISSPMHYEKEQNSLESPGSLQSDEYEVDSATDDDDDDLIINIETKKKKTAIIGSQALERMLENQESGLKEARIFEEEPNKNMLEVQKSNDVGPDKKRKSLLNLELKRNGYMSATPGAKRHMQTLPDEMSSGMQTTELEDGFRESTKVSWSQKSSWRQLLGDGSSGAFNASHILPGLNSSKEKGSDYAPESANKTDKKEKGSDCAPESANNKTDQMEMDGDLENKPTNKQVMEGLAEVQPTKKNVAPKQSGRGAAWQQKQSWTQLVSENNNSFSISQILPGITFPKPVAEEAIVDLAISSGCKHNDLAKNTNIESVSDGFNSVKSTPEMNEHVASDDIAPAPIIEKNCETDVKETSNDITIGETCSFMRSAASLREWAKTKASLSGSLKRKRGAKQEH